MNRLCNRIEQFPALFWALGIVLAHDPAVDLASLNRGTGTVLYDRNQLNFTEEASPPTHFLFSCILTLCLSPVCIIVLWVLGSYKDRQVAQYYTADRAVIQTGERRLNL